MKTKLKTFLLSLLLANLFLSQTGLAFAADAGSTVYDYSKSGVEKSIKDYLCTPTSAPNQAAPNYDLYNCINKLYKFAIALGGAIAMFFIVVAGYIYMYAEGNSESVDKAKSILTSSIAALVILMAGYVLLKALNPELVKFQTIQPTSVTPPPSASEGTSDDQSARNKLSAAGITVNSATKTSLAGIKDSTLKEIIDLKSSCSSCAITVTGGTESGHSTTGDCNHGSGYKVDLRLETNLDNYIKQNFDPSIGIRKSDKAPQWQHRTTGAIYALESDHWDVSVCR